MIYWLRAFRIALQNNSDKKNETLENLLSRLDMYGS